MSYSYDGASELMGIGYQLGQNSLGNLTYSYDLTGRRISMGGSLAAVNLPNAISTTGYNADNQLTQWGTSTPTYDLNGNMLSDGTNTYVWNARNQLASMNLTGESFQYDPFGRRTAKTTLGTTTNCLYDGANPVQELSGTTPTANMLTGGTDEYFTRTDSTGTANFLTDALGSTVALTNSSGSAIASYTYEPFGNTTASGSSTNTYQYTGREDDGTGVYFYRNRYYSPALQGFISEYPLGFAGGINLYSYVEEAPTNFSDAFGLQGPGVASEPPVGVNPPEPTSEEVDQVIQELENLANGSGEATEGVTGGGEAAGPVGALIGLDIGLAVYDGNQALNLACAYGYCLPTINNAQRGNRNVHETEFEQSTDQDVDWIAKNDPDPARRLRAQRERKARRRRNKRKRGRYN